MTVKGVTRTAPRDRYAELLVIVAVIASLAVGWGVKAGAEARAVRFESAVLQVRYGHNWVRETSLPPELIRIVDPDSGGRFRTTITVSRLDGTGVEADVARALNQARMRDEEMFRALSASQIEWRGRQVYRNEFAYVYASPDLLNPRSPVVVRGVDYVFRHGDAVYVTTCIADEGVYDEALTDFQRFLKSLTPG
jgi:hypothetical protein